MKQILWMMDHGFGRDHWKEVGGVEGEIGSEQKMAFIHIRLIRDACYFSTMM